MPDAITIHTDGAGAGNPGPGGFAAIVESPKHGELVITGGDTQTTNNRMELSAIIEALKAVNSGKWEWVKGHNGDPMNERCDRLAVAQAQAAPNQPSYWINAGGQPFQEAEPARKPAAAAAPIDTAGEQQAGVTNRQAIYQEIERKRRRQNAIYGPPSPEQHRNESSAKTQKRPQSNPLRSGVI